MPPKKTLKAIAAELKKKNTAEAEDIVAKLKSQIDMASTSGTGKTVTSTKGNRDSTVDQPETGEATEHVKKLRKKTENVIVTEKKKKKTPEAVEMAAKITRTSRKRVNVRDMAATVKTTKTTVEIDSDSIEVVESDDGSTKSTSQRTKPVPILALSSKNANSAAKAAVRSKSGSSNGYQYQYEIDCKRVADSINVIDLQKHLEKHLKVNGEKNNLGNTVMVACEGQKVVIKSKTFLPKKSLRFLSKKFLKKNWNIQVVSKNVHSYEYKYVGTL